MNRDGREEMLKEAKVMTWMFVIIVALDVIFIIKYPIIAFFSNCLWLFTGFLSALSINIFDIEKKLDPQNNSDKNSLEDWIVLSLMGPSLILIYLLPRMFNRYKRH